MINSTIKVEIRKPLYGTFCYIRDVYISRAKKEGKMLEITIPQGTMIVSPEEWMEGAKRMEKVFKIPNKPMVLYGNNVKLSSE